jgi:hypothetical protein
MMQKKNVTIDDTVTPTFFQTLWLSIVTMSIYRWQDVIKTKLKEANNVITKFWSSNLINSPQLTYIYIYIYIYIYKNILLFLIFYSILSWKFASCQYWPFKSAVTPFPCKICALLNFQSGKSEAIYYMLPTRRMFGSSGNEIVISAGDNLK